MNHSSYSIINLKKKYIEFAKDQQFKIINEINDYVNQFKNENERKIQSVLFLDLESISYNQLSSEKNILDLVSIGDVIPLDNFSNEFDTKIKIPFLYPFNQINGTTFLIDNNHNEIKNLMQNIALRFMLYLSPSISKFSFIDSDYGKNFREINQIINPTINKETIVNTNNIDETIKDLENIITDANLKYLGKQNCNNLWEYNKSAGLLAKPFHFVFISNYPDGFNNDTCESLIKLIKNKNACKAGIFIFISHEKKNTQNIYGFNPSDLLNHTVLFKKSNNNYIVENLPSYNFNISKYKIQLHTQLPKTIDTYLAKLNELKPEAIIMTFKHKFESMIKADKLWQHNSIYGIKIPIGFIDPQKIHFFKLGQSDENDTIDSNDFHCFIGGVTRFGKTVLLHNIILNTCLLYSPEEVNLQLIDWKGGTSFQFYTKLPHVTVSILSENREYALSAMSNLIEKEYKDRSKLFKAAGANDIISYRNITGKPLPRILLIIDEAHNFLGTEDPLSYSLRDSIEKIMSLGGSYGFHLILTTQNVSQFKIMPNLKNAKRRYSLYQKERDDSERVLGEGQFQATKLAERGKAVMYNGDPNLTVEFKVAFLNDKDDTIPNLVNAIFTKSQLTKCKINLDKYISDDNMPVKLNFDELFPNGFVINDNTCNIYIGEPSFIRRKHSFFKFQKESKSNLLLVGIDTLSALKLVSIITYQLLKQSSNETIIYVLDLFNIDNQYYKKIETLDKLSKQIKIGYKKDVNSFIDEVNNEIESRNQYLENGTLFSSRIVLIILNYPNCDNLIKDDYGSTSSVANVLFNILKKGPELGVHTIIQANTKDKIEEGFDYTTKNYFENRIALFGGNSTEILKSSNSSMVSSVATYKGLGVIEASEAVTTYNADLFKIYTEVINKNNDEQINIINEIINIKENIEDGN